METCLGLIYIPMFVAWLRKTALHYMAVTVALLWICGQMVLDGFQLSISYLPRWRGWTDHIGAYIKSWLKSFGAFTVTFFVPLALWLLGQRGTLTEDEAKQAKLRAALPSILVLGTYPTSTPGGNGIGAHGLPELSAS